MRKLVMLAAFVAAMVFPTASHAQFTLGLRVGYAPAMGDFASDVAMKDFSLKSQIPVQVDALYRITKDISAGAYFSYGFGQVDYAVCDAADCSGSSMRFGIQGFYSFSTVSPTFVPWAGLGIGYEMANDTFEIGGSKTESSYSGIEFLNLQVGGDYKVNEKLAVGPYVMYSMGQYSSMTVKEDGVTTIDGDINQTAMHSWLGFGVRGKFDL
ncbi:MAG TPA: hypothetical protein VFL83_00730 [Anaeromyxobacter sp.]|nr:hypothetical protein [Anaeromyxobacter sp.]